MAVARKELILKVMDIARQELCAVGMRKRSGNIFTFELNMEAIGWVGLNTGVRSYGGQLAVNPVVGVRHQIIEKTLADIEGKKFHSYIPPTISTHIGYLMPQKSYTPWLFTENTDHTTTVQEMVIAIIKFSKPFMEANATLDAICEAMSSSRYGILDYNIYHIPVAYFLLGEASLTEKFLHDQLKEIGDRDDVSAQDYKKFAVSFLKKLQNA